MDNLKINELQRRELERISKQTHYGAQPPELTKKNINNNELQYHVESMKFLVNLKINEFMNSEKTYEDYMLFVKYLEELVHKAKRIGIEMENNNEGGI